MNAITQGKERKVKTKIHCRDCRLVGVNLPLYQKWNSIKTFCLEKGDCRLAKLIEHKKSKILLTHL